MKNRYSLPGFLKVTGIPKLAWTSPRPLTLRPPLISFIMLVTGQILFGLGEAMLIAAGVGVSPWTVFAQGMAIHTDLTIGQTTFIISAFVLLFWIPLRQTPGMGTVLNIIIISLVLDFSLPYLPVFEATSLKVIQAAAGVFITGFGGAIYLIANLGPGPRDGLMTGIQRLTGLPIAAVRSGIEISVVSIGWSLGGVVGIGTLLFAFGIGSCLSLSLYLLAAVFKNRA